MNNMFMDRNELNNFYLRNRKEIPPLSFPTGIEIKLVPPFNGALARFTASKTGYPETWVSVCYDIDNSLGICGYQEDNETPIPYWELWPNEEGDNERFTKEETAKLVPRIMEILNFQARTE